MNEIKLAEESLQQVRKDLGLVDNASIECMENPYERLLDFLETELRRMLDNDFTGLMNTLYRIDVSEKKVTEILEETAPDEIARALAQVVLEREKLKVLTRQQYRNS